MKRTLLPAIFLASLVLAAPAWAASLYSFTANTPARAASVNANFTGLNDDISALAGTVNGNFSVLQQALPAVKGFESRIWTTVPSTPSVLDSIQAVAPHGGNFVISATGSVAYGHTTGINGEIGLDLDPGANATPGVIPNAGSITATRNWVASTLPTMGGGLFFPYHIVEVVPVTNGQNVKFYLNGYATGLHGVSLFHNYMSILFVPGSL